MLDSGLWGGDECERGGHLRRLRAVDLERERKQNQEPLGNVNFSRGL